MSKLPYSIDDLFQPDIPEAIDLPELADTPASQNSFTDSVSADIFIGGELASKIQDKNEQLFTTGEAINALATPQAVYKDTDGLIYKTDANVAGKIRFFGFAKVGENVNSGEVIKVIVEGKVDGFTGLTSGQFVYLTDTPGSISHTASTTTVIRVGIAVSTTEILILKGQKNITGSLSKSCSTTAINTTVTVGFRPRIIYVFSALRGNDSGSCNGEPTMCSSAWSDSASQGGVCMSTGSYISLRSGDVGSSDSSDFDVFNIAIDTVNETSFRIFSTVTASGAGGIFQADVFYIVFGE